MKRDFSITEIIGAACNLMNKHWIIFIGIALIEMVLDASFTESAGMNSINFKNPEIAMMQLSEITSEIFSIISLIGWIIKATFAALIIKMAFNAIDNKSVSLEALKMPMMKYVNFIAVYLITDIIICVGFILCVIPGLYLATRLCFAHFYTIDRGYSITDAIKASWHDTEGNFWHLLGFGISVELFGIAGVLLCCVGIVYTIPASFIAKAIVARLFSQTSNYTPEEVEAQNVPTAAPQSEETNANDNQSDYKKTY